jgi:hypothetical protein
MSAAAQAFKNKYRYRATDAIVAFSIPSRIYRRNFNDEGYNFFVICKDNNDGDDELRNNKNYELCERQQFRFRQFQPIYNANDSDNHLRIVPFVAAGSIAGARMDFLYFATNFLDIFADINNVFKFTDRKSFNSIRTLNIYRKIS